MQTKTSAVTRALSRLGLGRDRDYVIENLSLLVSSGMGIPEALDSIIEDLHSRRMRLSIEQMRSAIADGSPLWVALEQAALFPSAVVSLVRIGEESGRLTQNLRVISLQQQKERIFRSRIRSAMMYPLFVLSLTLVIGVGIAWFILPKLATVFSQLHLKLPLITQVLIGAGVVLGKHGAWLIPLFILGVVVVVYVIFFNPATKHIGQRCIFALPGVRQLIIQIELSRFGYLLGTLLDAGLPITQALSSLAEATSSPPYTRLYAHLITSIDEGNSFQKSFDTYAKLSRIMPRPIQQLIVTGERSGKLSETLLFVSKDYEEKSETTTKDLTIVLEPVLLVIVWLGVVSVALAVILPIYSLIGGLQSS